MSYEAYNLSSYTDLPTTILPEYKERLLIYIDIAGDVLQKRMSAE